MAGTGRTILDHNVNLRKEVMNGLIIRQKKQEFWELQRAELPHLECLPSNLFLSLLICFFLFYETYHSNIPPNNPIDSSTITAPFFKLKKKKNLWEVKWSALDCRVDLWQSWGLKLGLLTPEPAIKNNLTVLCAQLLSHIWLFLTPWIAARQVPLSVGIFQARILECCHALLQGILPTQGSNPGLLHCRRILYQLSHQGSCSTGQYYIAAHWGSGSSEPWASWSAMHSSPDILCRRDLRLQLHIQGHPLLCQPDSTLLSHLFIPTSHCSCESLGHLLSWNPQCKQVSTGFILLCG